MKLSLYIMAVVLHFLGHPDYTGGQVVQTTEGGNSVAKATYKKIIIR